MEVSSFHELPPSKRFKLLHSQDRPADPYSPQSLPAKKRFGSLHVHRPAPSLCLPAKKRVWAPSPVGDLESQPQESLENEQPQEENSAAPAKVVERKEDAVDQAADEEEEEEDDGVLCAVCRSTDGDPLDPIVFCDGCDLMVHASCYGTPLVDSVPEGDWFCSRCERRRGEEAEFDPACCLCPVRGGAMKPAADGLGWAHIVCALYVPEVFFRDPRGREGVDCSRVPDKRWKKPCYLCGAAGGCAVECSEPKCRLGFHVSCGLERDLCFEYKERRGAAIVAGFCADHTELWKKQQSTGKFRIVAREADQAGKNNNKA